MPERSSSSDRFPRPFIPNVGSPFASERETHFGLIIRRGDLLSQYYVDIVCLRRHPNDVS